MAFFTAYFDESGVDPGIGDEPTSDTPLLVVAGYIAQDCEWAAFSKRWDVALDRFHIPYFHMAPFANRKQPYRGWSESKADSCINELLGLIEQYARGRVSFAIQIKDYSSTIKAADPQNPYLARAYSICSTACLSLLRVWAKAAGYCEGIAYVFESAPKPIACDLFNAFNDLKIRDYFGINSITFGDKRKLKPLQASDILAQQTYRVTCDQLSATPRFTRRLYAERLGRTKGQTILLDASALDEIVEITRDVARRKAIGLAGEDPFPEVAVNFESDMFKDSKC
jgi:hypothetical protein